MEELFLIYDERLRQVMYLNIGLIAVIVLVFIGLSICARIYAEDGKIALICLGVGEFLH